MFLKVQVVGPELQQQAFPPGCKGIAGEVAELYASFETDSQHDETIDFHLFKNADAENKDDEGVAPLSPDNIEGLEVACFC